MTLVLIDTLRGAMRFQAPRQCGQARQIRPGAWGPDSSQKEAEFRPFASTVLPRSRGGGFGQNGALNVITLACNHLGVVSAEGIEPSTY